jgi:hypothetical protein
MVNGWTYVNPPQINELDPDEGQVGTTVTVSGTDMLAGAEKIESATLAGTAVSSIVSSNATHVVVVAGKKTGDAEGVVVLVADSGATVTSALNWTYTNASVITKVEPASGQHKTEVVISGERMHGGGSKIVTVLLADAVATIDAETTNEINVTAGASAAGKGDVVVKADSGASTTLQDGFTYLAPGKISSVTPSKGQLNTKVTIVGTDLLGGGDELDKVTLDGTEATITTGDNATHVEVVAQSGGAGVGDVVLTADTGAVVTAKDGWTQLADGEITKVDPNKGVRGSIVTISGASLLAVPQTWRR